MSNLFSTYCNTLSFTMYNWFCQFMSCGKKVCIIFDRDHAICLWLGVVEPRLIPEEGMAMKIASHLTKKQSGN